MGLEFVETQAKATEVVFDCRDIQVAQLLHRPYSELLKPFSVHFSDTRQSSNRQRSEKCIHLVWLDDEQSIWFAPVRSDCRVLVFSNSPEDDDGRAGPVWIGL